MRIKNKAAMDAVTGTNCLICFKPSDAAHIKSRGAGGDDAHDNLIPLCRWHHQLQHSMGWAKFTMGWPIVLNALKDRGWEIRREFGILRLRKI